MNQRLAAKRELIRNTQYRAVTAAEVRQHGLCKGEHKGLGYWRLFCGCMEHPQGVSCTEGRGMTDPFLVSLYVVAVVCLVAQWATARRGPDIKLFTGEDQ